MRNSGKCMSEANAINIPALNIWIAERYNLYVLNNSLKAKIKKKLAIKILVKPKKSMLMLAKTMKQNPGTKLGGLIIL